MSDPRLAVVMEHLFTTGAFERNDIGIPMARTRAWMIVDALDGFAARSALSAPAEGVRVRVARCWTS